MSMGGMEVTAEMVQQHERAFWSQQLAAAIAEAAKLSAANQVIIGRVREVEQELADQQQIARQVNDQYRESQDALQRLVEERDALAGGIESVGRAAERSEERYQELADKWAEALAEKDRLRQMVRDLGGDPEPPTEPEAPAEPDPGLTADGHAFDCSPYSVTGCAPHCPLSGTPGERPIPVGMRTKADEIREGVANSDEGENPDAGNDGPDPGTPGSLRER